MMVERLVQMPERDYEEIINVLEEVQNKSMKPLVACEIIAKILKGEED
jgi:hypothetical protein